MNKPSLRLLMLLTLVFALLQCTAVVRVLRASEPQGVMRVRVNELTTVYTPSGILINLPPGSEFDVCADAGIAVTYPISARALIAERACPLRPVFRDSFEDPQP
jgi:hypothetical protein